MAGIAMNPDDGTGMTPQTQAPDAAVARAILTSFAEGFGVEPQRAAHLVAAKTVDSLAATDLKPTLLAIAVDSGATPHGCTYVSTPITTGRNHIDRLVAHAAQGSSADAVPDREEIVASNRKRARAVVEQLRRDTGDVVIDPTSLVDVPDWEQPDYHALWIETIESFASRMVFVDDWQYSVGCTTEFRSALINDIPTFDQRRQPLTYAAGLALLRQAVAEVGTAAGSGPLLTREVEAIERLLASRGENEG
jgi:hypothetical protein